MNTSSSIIKNDQGMALVICLMIMVVMALIATGVTTNSTVEIKIAGNQRNKAVSFNNADVGTGITPEIIEQNLDAVSWESSDTGWDATHTPNQAYLFLTADNNGDGTNDINIFVNEDPKYNPAHKIAFATITTALNSPAIEITGDVNTSLDISKTGGLAAGNAIQMAAGYEGLGKGAGGGGYHAYYLCDSAGSAGNNTGADNQLYYRHVAK